MKIGVLIVHGMGSQTRDGFEKNAQRLADTLTKQIAENDADSSSIAWQAAYWGDILQRNQAALLQKLKAGNDLDWNWLRKFVINNLGDAVAYQRKPSQDTDFYCQIHDRVHERIVDLQNRVGETAPLIILAHSLGSYITSNYIWDRQHHHNEDKYGRTPFERLETLASLVTFGSNIAIFSLALDPYVGFEFPTKKLPSPIAAVARWLNFYDSDDVLGYPVKPLCAEYAANPRIEDRNIRAGGLFSTWNPLSHNEYWTDNSFTEPVAAQIATVLKRLD
jgi:hypothetical protein